MEINFKHSIGDTVYTASSEGVEKRIIDKIELWTEDHKIYYGFKINTDSYYTAWSFGIGRKTHIYFKEENVFSRRKEAKATHEFLKKTDDVKKQKINSLRQQIYELEDE